MIACTIIMTNQSQYNVIISINATITIFIGKHAYLWLSKVANYNNIYREIINQ